MDTDDKEIKKEDEDKSKDNEKKKDDKEKDDKDPKDAKEKEKEKEKEVEKKPETAQDRLIKVQFSLVIDFYKPIFIYNSNMQGWEAGAARRRMFLVPWSRSRSCLKKK